MNKLEGEGGERRSCRKRKLSKRLNFDLTFEGQPLTYPKAMRTTFQVNHPSAKVEKNIHGTKKGPLTEKLQVQPPTLSVEVEVQENSLGEEDEDEVVVAAAPCLCLIDENVFLSPNSYQYCVPSDSFKCQATELSGKLVKRCNATPTDSQLHRVSKSQKFRILCQLHLLRLRKHKWFMCHKCLSFPNLFHSSCPFCSNFCVEEDPSVFRCVVMDLNSREEQHQHPHLFHKACIEKTGLEGCPHCEDFEETRAGYEEKKAPAQTSSIIHENHLENFTE